MIRIVLDETARIEWMGYFTHIYCRAWRLSTLIAESFHQTAVERIICHCE